jgi:hypothetical protein
MGLPARRGAAGGGPAVTDHAVLSGERRAQERIVVIGDDVGLSFLLLNVCPL